MRGKPRPKTIDGYLATVPAKMGAALRKLRKDIQAAAPEAEECISYGMPAFRLLNGRMVVYFAAWENHCAFYPGAVPIRVHAAALKKYDTSKGTVRYAPEKPLSTALVRKLVKARISE